MKASLYKRFPILKDILNLVIFIGLVILGTTIINNFIFRTYNVQGPSMENTLHTSDRLIVNRIPVTIARLQNKQYTPERCQIIVFKNPRYSIMQKDEFIVKRVVAFGGESISLKNGIYTVVSEEKPNGFNPDDCANTEPKNNTNGEIQNYIIPKDELFVSGDNRVENFSYDSRNGLGTIPISDVIGPVTTRIFPFNQIRTF